MDAHKLQLNECRYHALQLHAGARGKSVAQVIEEAVEFYGLDRDAIDIELVQRAAGDCHEGACPLVDDAATDDQGAA